jgi:hypothetical protein
MVMITMALGFWFVANGSQKPLRCALKQVLGMSCANPATAAGMELGYPDDATTLQQGRRQMVVKVEKVMWLQSH